MQYVEHKQLSNKMAHDLLLKYAGHLFPEVILSSKQSSIDFDQTIETVTFGFQLE